MIHALDIALLRRLLADELSPAEKAELETRLESEPELLELLARLSQPTLSETPVLAVARESFPTPPEVRELIENLRAAPAAAAPDVGPGDWVALLAPPAEGDPPEALGRVGDYPVLGHIATGGTAHVFRVLDPKLKREVALKILSPVLAHDPTTRRRFLREARAAARLEHENVLPIHHVVDGELPHFTMRHLSGGSLQDLLDAGRSFTTDELKTIALKVARALQAAHREGIIHRDIKPANILFGSDLSSLMVCDFGIATSIEDPGLTNPGSIIGTPHYMSPEQASGYLLDGRSDLFSLGSVLFHCATGRPPFEGESSTSVLQKLVSDDPARLDRPRAGLPPWFRNLLLRLLAKKPTHRVRDAATLVEILETERKLAPPRRGLSHTPLAWIGIAAAAVALAFYGIHRTQAPDVDQLIAGREARQAAEIRELLDQARLAMADGRNARALELADRALELRADDPEATYVRRYLLATSAFARPLATPVLDFAPTEVAAHPDGFLITGDDQRAVIALPARSLAVPADDILLTAEEDGLIHFTHQATGQGLLDPLDRGGDTGRFAFSPDTAALATLDAQGVHLWDVAALRPPHELATLDPAAAWLSFEQQSDTLWLMDGNAALYNWSAPGRPFRISRMAGFEDDFFADFEATGLRDHLWTFWQGGNQRGIAGNPMQALAAMVHIETHTQKHGTSLMISTMARDRDVLVIADSAGAIGIRNPQGSYDFLPGPQVPVTRIALSARGEIGAAILENGELLSFSPAAGSIHHRWKPDSPLRSLAFLDSGEVLITAGKDGGIDFYNPLDGERLRAPIPTGAAALEVSAVPGRDEFLTCSESDRLIRRWSATTRELLHTGMEHARGVLWFSPSLDGRFVFSIDQEIHDPKTGALRIWSLDRGEEIVPALEHDTPLKCATLYANGTRIATAGFDGSVRRWTANPRLTTPLPQPEIRPAE